LRWLGSRLEAALTSSEGGYYTAGVAGSQGGYERCDDVISSAVG